ncbi:MAG: transporter substrate-binding protein [Rhodocyclaceae bacterium]|nr:transporter substrate-binding protein [Rhodocyclaceae bacterium]
MAAGSLPIVASNRGPTTAHRTAAAFIRLLVAILAPLLAMPWAMATELLQIKISAPGPRNLSYLPLELIPRIGADRAEGARVHLKYVDGGSNALRHLVSRNVDFGAAGVPAMLSQQANGEDVVLLAAVSDQPLYVLVVRSDLRKEVKTIGDLKGRTIAVSARTLTSKTTSLQLAELLLRSGNVPLDRVRFVSAGQGWNEQSAVLSSRTADALMSFEPVAHRLLTENRAYSLASLADPATAARIPGGGFLLAAVATRPEVVAQEPRKAEMMVAILRRTLQWMATHTPEQIVEALAIQDAPEGAALLGALRKYPRLYSRDGRLSTKQIHETEAFFQATHADTAIARHIHLESMIDAQWAGRTD